MIIKPQANMQKRQSFGASEFTHSFSFTPSSELNEWTNVGNSEWGYRDGFGYSLLYLSEENQYASDSLRVSLNDDGCCQGGNDLQLFHSRCTAPVLVLKNDAWKPY